MEPENSAAWRFLPSIADVLFVRVLFYFFFKGPSALLGDGDTGYHIRAGEYILKTLSIPKYDIFSFHSPPLPWTAHEWLSEVIMALIHGACGLSGIVAFFSFLLALTGFLLFKILRSYGTNILLAALVTVLALVSAQLHFLARPHVFSFLMMMACQYLLESWHRGRSNRLYLLPPMMLLWVNLHGGFLGGFILMGAYLVGGAASALTAPAECRPSKMQRVRQLGKVILLCLVCCLFNPRGYHILLFPFHLVSDSYIMDHVEEFLSPDFHRTMPFKYLLLLLIALLAVTKKKIEATEVILILVFTHMSLYSARYIPLFALVTAPILTRNAPDGQEMPLSRLVAFLRRRSERIATLEARAGGGVWPAAALIVVAAALFSGKYPHGFDQSIKPVAACEFLMKQPIAGNMFNNDEFGDYLIYRGYPFYKVFMDGRSDMYGTEILKEYGKVIDFQPGWESVLAKYGITWIFFDADSRLSRYLLRDRQWVLIYSDKVANIFVRNLPQYKRLIEKYHDVKPVQIPSHS